MLGHEAVPLAEALPRIGNVIKLDLRRLGLDEAPEPPQQVADRYVGPRRRLRSQGLAPSEPRGLRGSKTSCARVRPAEAHELIARDPPH